MTTRWSAERVFDRLKQAAPVWEAVRQMPLADFQALIADAGLSNQKAPRIKAILERLPEDFGCVKLDGLSEMSDADAESYLTSLPGVGLKTAKCVLMYSLGRDVLPVDTHVQRVATRLGLVPLNTPLTEIHQALEVVVRPSDRYDFHVNALSHGRQVCIALRPRCESCPVRGFCDFGVKSAASRRDEIHLLA
jgi:endonuclease III